MKNFKWILIFTVVCVACIWGWLKMGRTVVCSPVAQIKQGDEVIYSINLSEVDEPYEW